MLNYSGICSGCVCPCSFALPLRILGTKRSVIGTLPELIHYFCILSFLVVLCRFREKGASLICFSLVCGLCTVCYRLFVLLLGVIGRL